MGKPEIRFKGYTDEWEQRKLGELVGIYDGVHQTPDYQDSGIMFLSVENIATLKSEKYISEEAFERDYKVYPEKGDILMTRIGDVGTTNVVETAEKVAFYVSLALLKPNGIDSYFLSNAMKTNAFQKGLRERTLVTAIPQKINKDEIGKIDIFITNNDEEQKKIGAYFSNLDHLITLHQRKCDEVKCLKKYMLQKMFPQNEQKVPEIRFEGFTEAWEQRKLEECLSEITYGFTNPMSDTEEGPWKITAKDILDGMINYSSARHTSQIEYDDLTNKSKPLVGDLLLTKDGTLGRTAIVDAENVCINQSVALLRFNEKCSVQYAKTLLDTPMYQKQMLDDAGGGTIKHIYITKVDKMFISVPCMKEQERLVLFFNNLDNLITLHQQKCEELKKIKKFMLQKMFV